MLAAEIQNIATFKDDVNTAKILFQSSSADRKNAALEAMIEALEKNKELILKANEKDLEDAKPLVDSGKLKLSTYNRLKLDENKFREMIQGIRDVIGLDDPVNKKVWAMKLDNGLNLYKQSCPLGVVGVVFESRPDVIVQISALMIKSGNVVVMKGGKESKNTNVALYETIKNAIETVKGMPENVVNLLLSRHGFGQILKLDDTIDLIIPRGSAEFVKWVQDNTKIPVLGHSSGVCHIYIEPTAKHEEAIEICVDSKIQNPSACNAVETILVDYELKDTLLPKLVEKLRANGVEVRGCEECRAIVPDIILADEDDWFSEYGDKIVSIKIVRGIYGAVKHINNYGSKHTDCIITEDEDAALAFTNNVDTGNIFVNASTRFSDGYRYGFGAEVGISTGKLHARGPVGLEGLTTYKYLLYGEGQTVKEYCSGEKKFIHERIM